MATELKLEQWDQSKFSGRLRYFIAITNPLKAFASLDTLQDSKRLLQLYRAGKEPYGTTVEDLQHAQAFYASAFHPDTGQLQTLPGRMCANAWGGTLLCGAMMLWYKSTRAVVFWQWANQSFNAIVNYTNRNAQSPLSKRDLLVAYTSAVIGALGVAVACIFATFPAFRAFGCRSSCKHYQYLLHTIKLAACKAISLVVCSRNVIVAPSTLLIPLIMNAVEKYNWYVNRAKFLNIPMQLVITFVLYGSMIPVGCALFPQINSIKATTLMHYEPITYEELKHHMGVNMPATQRVFFDKGL